MTHLDTVMFESSDNQSTPLCLFIHGLWFDSQSENSDVAMQHFEARMALYSLNVLMCR